MAEIIEKTMADDTVIKEHKEIPSNAKANAGLTLGIIGTALAGVTALGGLGTLGGLWGGNTNLNKQQTHVITDLEQYLERQQCQNYLNITKEFYLGKLDGNRQLTEAFFDAYKRDVDNSFDLYKYSRDNYDVLNQKMTDASFNLYKNQRDSNDILASKIAEVDKKVDVMAAIRPYQDALIDAKINQNAIISDFNLARRTCHMIEGQLVLPSTPVVSGYGSYNPFITQTT